MRERDASYPDVDGWDNDPPIFRALTLERAEQRRDELSAPSTGVGSHHWRADPDTEPLTLPILEEAPRGRPDAS